MPADPTEHTPPTEPWTHGTSLGRDHNDIAQHLIEDHGQHHVDVSTTAAIHALHDRLHGGREWAYVADLPHPLVDPPVVLAGLVLDLPTAVDGYPTVRDYLRELLTQVWLGGWDAGPKYGFTGESDWRHDLYVPLRNAGMIPPWQDGYDPPGTRPDDLITAAIRALTGPPTPKQALPLPPPPLLASVVATFIVPGGIITEIPGTDVAVHVRSANRVIYVAEGVVFVGPTSGNPLPRLGEAVIASWRSTPNGCRRVDPHHPHVHHPARSLAPDTAPPPQPVWCRGTGGFD